MSTFEQYAGVVTRRLAAIETMVAELERRADNFIKEGRVTAVDPATGTVEVNMNGLDSDKIPWSTRAGAIREWSPPAVGERVMVLSPSGEPGLGIAMPGGFSDEYKQPHNKGAEHKLEIGLSSILMTSGKITITVGGTTFELTEAGLKATAPDYAFD